ncbi:MbcA/ParS/Xre antitoxin family protein [Photobacterium leiognathi]|uniref:MbcA/ParS/Xre antitoxin family protein n=1 Tax=Photobacterium leiognathi TaxID=553611 RepID=UPI002733EDA1|nr:MbcA/ParS/Xre antitoxin family protein [Photobacterium leiognathi]
MNTEYTQKNIWELGLDIFKNEASFHKWLQTPIPALSGKTPNELCNTKDGRIKVWHVLSAIKQGDFS